MDASVSLDQAGNVSFTNLDEITGRILVRNARPADITAVVVKLEGESRTRLLSPPGVNGERPKPQLEYHKILYKLQTVFPPQEIQEGRIPGISKSSYTLQAGQHEFPFRFKLPFNNECSQQKGMMPTFGVSGMGLEVAKAPTQHVRKTLPPTLTGFPGEAEIRYFVKVTVQRKSFFQENARAFTPFQFLPIEPPRPPASGSEVYGRQKHAFATGVSAPKKQSVFGSLGNLGRKDSSTKDIKPGDAPFVSVDARLPEPAILTCNRDLPLRVLVKKLNSSAEEVYLRSIEISLIGTTKIKAHDVFRTENNSWVFVTKSNMKTLLLSPTNPEGTETVVDERLWKGQNLPNTVAPSFVTCNIQRSYALDVKIGLSYGDKTLSVPQTIILPLRLDTQVYSGIAPPASLLAAMERRAQGQNAAAAGPLARPPAEARPPEKVDKPTPAQPAGEESSSAATASTSTSAQQPPLYPDAPPSYEDAVADDVAPIDAPRPDYAPPPVADDDDIRKDEKKGWVG